MIVSPVLPSNARAAAPQRREPITSRSTCSQSSPSASAGLPRRTSTSASAPDDPLQRTRHRPIRLDIDPSARGHRIAGLAQQHLCLLALCFAASEARTHGARLRAVIAWTIPSDFYMTGFTVALSDLSQELAREAKEALDGALDGLASELDGVEVDRVVLQGQAAGVLLEEAQEADLLVVGSRGRGGFSGLLLGSVSQQCAHHATPPIVIVRG
jgi:nucleotide-binding universal stress UspA family protein